MDIFKEEITKNSSNDLLLKKIQNTKYIFELSSDGNEKIDYTKNKLINIDVFDEYYKLSLKKYEIMKKSKNTEQIIKKSRFMKKSNIDILSKIIYFFFNEKNINRFYIKNFDVENNYYRFDNKNSDITLFEFDSSFYKKMYKNQDVLTKTNNRNISYIYFLYFITQNLQENSNIIINLLYFSPKIISIIELYSLFFEKVIIIGREYIICKNLKKNNIDIKKIINNNLKFSIKYNKVKEDNLKKYFNDYYSTHINMYKNFFDTGNENNFIKYRYFMNIQLIRSIGLDNLKEFEDDISLFYANNLKIIIYNKDDIQKIETNINTLEGNYISNIIKKYNFKKCLEIGLAHGISSIYILKNNVNLISIDPFQSSRWNNQGIKFIKHLKYDNHHSLVEKDSFIALPEFLQKKGNKYFDFIYIDGFHTFDNTLLDFFYSDLLLKIGGIIIIGDALQAGVADLVKYINTNYFHYQKINSPPSIAVFKKNNDDKRGLNFHKKIC